MTKSVGLVLSLVLLFAPLAAHGEELTLARCLALARAQNPSLQAAALAPQLAAERGQEARSAYRPRVDLQAGYTWQQAPQAVVFGGLTQQTQDQNYRHLSLGVDQLLYDFGRTSGRVAAADAAAQAASFGYAGNQQDIFLQTVAAYYGVLTADHLLQAAGEELTQTEAHRKDAEALFAEGVVTRNDVLQAQVRLAASQQLQLARGGELENAWLRLNYLTERAPEARGELQPEAGSALPTLPAAEAVAKRPELAAQRQAVIAAQEQVRQAAGEFWPELYAHLGADYVENSYVKESTIYAATFGLRGNLYDGGASSARLREARQSLDLQRRRLADLEQQAILDYRSAGNDARVAARRIEVAQTAIAQAEENLRINQDRYREQVGTATEVLDAQTLLTQTRTDLARAQFDYQVAMARVQRAAGSL
jgi:outer membrane protein